MLTEDELKDMAAHARYLKQLEEYWRLTELERMKINSKRNTRPMTPKEKEQSLPVPSRWWRVRALICNF